MCTDRQSNRPHYDGIMAVVNCPNPHSTPKGVNEGILMGASICLFIRSGLFGAGISLMNVHSPALILGLSK